MSAYKKVSHYEFEVEGTRLAIVDWTIDTNPDRWSSGNQPWVRIEELDKNGQEDTHMAGELIWTSLPCGKWGWKWFGGRGQFACYGSEALADAIPKFLTTNPLPRAMA